jgi:cell wall-associated NlpC family hydrolase
VGERVGTQVGRQQWAGAPWVRRAIGIGAVAVVFLVSAPGMAAAAPTNPSDSQISAAEQAKQDAAARVGAITAQLASAQAGADAAHQAAQIALQDYEDKQAAFETAKGAADAAAAAAATARTELAEGRDDVAAFARASYIQGTTAPGMTALLSSGGPAELIERAALLDAAGTHRTDVVAELTVLEDQAATADAVAQQTVTEAATLQTQAAESLASAQTQEQSARSQADVLSDQQAGLQAELQQAQQTLYGLEGARQAAQAYAAQQAAAAAAVPARTPVRVSAPPSSSGASSSGSSSSGSSSSGSSSSGSSSSGSSSSGGSSSGGSSSGGSSSGGSSTGGTAGAPSVSAAQTAIAAAKTQIGVLYSWGGGGSSGPSYGISPDTSVYGFDCSGLTQYAYARAGIGIGGTSRDQWWNNRNKQVDASDLQPGDLMFWASGSSYTSIYHVSIYIGGNKMIEAPDRGLRVMTSTVRYGSDYYGAVRPSA